MPNRVKVLTRDVPFPRGLALADPEGDGFESLYVLSRGRSRGDGGADPKLDDQAGTIWEVDPTTGETRVFAQPTSPPFRLLDRSLPRATHDTQTDRPYCVLRWDEMTRSFYICGFSGIDLPASDPDAAEGGYFRKNYSDVVLRFDVDTRTWSEVDRHEPDDGDHYPGRRGGWVKGPDNLAIIGDGLLVVAAKDNDRLVLYNLHDDNTEPRVILTDEVTTHNGERLEVLGHSALAVDGDWLYVGFRTTGQVIRVPISRDDGISLQTDAVEWLAQFQPFDRTTGRSANLTDLAIGPNGDVYVLSAQPARVYRFAPGLTRDFRDGSNAWLDLAALTGNPSLKSENLLVTDDGTVYLTSGNPYADQALGGTVWEVKP